MLSDVMLRVAPLTFWWCTCWPASTLCVGLSAIAVGLGAVLPNLREESPSKIAAGFGGTLNLVISTIYIIGVVGHDGDPQPSLSGRPGIRLRPCCGGPGPACCWAVLATVIPLRAGFRAFRELEF